ncbi:MAG: hypothetical protein LBC18_04990, partial [Opitutaceae bacterium]|nr:hypothetical protein [Opitutaceae bacterium]
MTECIVPRQIDFPCRHWGGGRNGDASGERHGILEKQMKNILTPCFLGSLAVSMITRQTITIDFTKAV